MTDETNAYAVKINGVTFVSMNAAKSIVDEARKDAWNLAMEEAADEIERLRAALREIAEINEYNPDMPENDMRAYFSGPLFAISEIARAALEGK